jgi:hypothetical protein
MFILPKLIDSKRNGLMRSLQPNLNSRSITQGFVIQDFILNIKDLGKHIFGWRMMIVGFGVTITGRLIITTL